MILFIDNQTILFIQSIEEFIELYTQSQSIKGTVDAADLIQGLYDYLSDTTGRVDETTFSSQLEEAISLTGTKVKILKDIASEVNISDIIKGIVKKTDASSEVKDSDVIKSIVKDK